MIKVGITGGETHRAGELLRILIHHPDVEIVSVCSPANAGRLVASVHHGFIGEERLIFTSSVDASALDMVFMLEPVHNANDWAKLMAMRPQLKLILSPQCASLSDGLDTQGVYGLSEMNRKPLVRGARCALLPTPAASVALLALYPLAKHLMLPADVKISLSMPCDLLSEECKVKAMEEMRTQLSLVQASLDNEIEYEWNDSGRDRGMAVEFEITGLTAVEELFKIYDSVYDDHNFTYLVGDDVDYREVEGTQRCIVSLSKPVPDRIRVRAVADARMRGNAGEAVHLMNLLCGLYEKTGLDLKTINYF